MKGWGREKLDFFKATLTSCNLGDVELLHGNEIQLVGYRKGNSFDHHIHFKGCKKTLNNSCEDHNFIQSIMCLACLDFE